MSLIVIKPSIVIVSSSNTKPKSLVKLITRSPAIEHEGEPNIVSQEWEIDTKYYSANVNIFGITEDFVRDDNFNSSVEALLIHMDSNKESGLSDLKKWTKIENDCNIEVKLLISNYFTSKTKISKAEATKWCLKRGYELIELYPNTESILQESDSNDIIEEKRGVDRVIEALQTHIWPNLLMKDSTSCNEDKSEVKLHSNTGNSDQTLNDFLTEDGVDNFTDLFSQLNMLKESLGSMSNTQRKQNAEQMVTKFWQAIGGDEEELSDA